jgi:hypothetical protein
MHEGGTTVFVLDVKGKRKRNGMIQQFLFLMVIFSLSSLDVYESVKSSSAKRVRLFCRKIVKKKELKSSLSDSLCVSAQGLRGEGGYPFKWEGQKLSYTFCSLDKPSVLLRVEIPYIHTYQNLLTIRRCKTFLFSDPNF